MIEFTIRTLDCTDHRFSVDENLTIEQLKKLIEKKLGVHTSSQRLIYQGRLMQNDKKLSEFEIENKVIHLVLGSPPNAPHRRSASSPGTSRGARRPRQSHSQTPGIGQSLHRELLRLMTAGNLEMNTSQQQSSSPAEARLESLRLTISEIKSTICNITENETQNNAENNAEPSSQSHADPAAQSNVDPRPQSSVDPIPQSSAERGSESKTDSTNVPLHSPRSSRPSRRTTCSRQSEVGGAASQPQINIPEQPPARQLNTLLTELDRLYADFAPFRSTIVSSLWDTTSDAPPRSEQTPTYLQRLSDLFREALHGFAHAFHAISDMSIQYGDTTPVVNVEANTARQPVHAHISLVQANPRPHQHSHSSGNPNTSSHESNLMQDSPESILNVRLPDADDIDNSEDEGMGNLLSSSLSDYNSPTHHDRTESQEPPLTLQIELQSREPFESALLSAIANSVAGGNPDLHHLSQSQTPRFMSTTDRDEEMPGTNDFENIFRELGQGHMHGVEVVMRMEETSGNTSEAATHSHPPSAAFISPITWTSVTRTPVDEPHTFTSTGLGQNFMPAVAVNIQSSRLHGRPGAGQQTSQDQEPAQSEDTSTQSSTTQTPSQPRNANSVGHGPHTSRQRTRAARHQNWYSRNEMTPLWTCVYDRFLQCNSIYAERQLNSRRNRYLQERIAQEQAEGERMTSRTIDLLTMLIPEISQAHRTLMLELLNDSSSSTMAIMNSFLIAIARYLFILEPMQTLPYPPDHEPLEFTRMRTHLRFFMRELIESTDSEGNDLGFDYATEYLIGQHEDFLRTLDTLVTIRPVVDIIASVRNLVRSRLPAIIACVMSDSVSDLSITRFFAVFARLFTDICSLAYHTCHYNEHALRTIVKTLMERIMSNSSGQPHTAMLMMLVDVNITGVISKLRRHVRTIWPFIVVRRESPGSSSSRSDNLDASSTPLQSVAASPAPRTNQDAGAPEPSQPSTSYLAHSRSSYLHPPPDNRSPPPTRPPKAPYSSNDDADVATVREDVQGNSSAQASQSEDGVREPFTDSYANGMPPRNRMSLRDSRPSQHGDTLFDECVRDNFEMVQSNSDVATELRDVFREHLRILTAARAAASEDYDPARFNSTSMFIDETGSRSRLKC